MKNYHINLQKQIDQRIEVTLKKKLKTVVKFYAPYHLFIDPNEKFQIRLPKNPEKVHTLQVISRTGFQANFNHKLFGLSREDDFNNKALYTTAGDRFGITGYSTVEITYDRYSSITDERNNLDFEQLLKLMERICEIYNYFLDRYSAVVKHRQLSKLAPLDIHTVDITYIDDKNSTVQKFKLSTIHGATLMKEMVSAPTKVNSRLNELLENPNNTLDSIGVNAVRTVYSGDYLNGIVQAVTQLESFLYLLFDEYFNQKGIAEIEEKLKSLGLKNLIDFLPIVLEEESYKELRSIVDFQKIKDSINIRNKYVHKAENIASISSLQKAEEYVNAIIILCVKIADFLGLDHMMDENKTGWS